MNRFTSDLLSFFICCLFPCALFLGAVPSAQAQSAAPADTLVLTVEQAIQQALRISPEVAIEQSGVQFAEARRDFALANRFLTEFTATSAHSLAPGLDIPEDNTFPTDELYLNPDVRNDWSRPRPFTRLNFELVQPIYTWGQLGGSIRAARHGVAVEEAVVSQKEAEVALRTGELYYGFLLTDALSLLAERAGEIVQQAKNEIERLLNEGAPDVDDADLFQVLITEQEYNSRVVEVSQSYQTARVALARQLFLPPGTAIVASDSVLAPIPFAIDSLDTYLDLAMQNRAELAQARAGLAARDALVDVARSDYYPKLFLAASAQRSFISGRYGQPSPYIGDPFLGNNLLAGLGLRYNLNVVQTRAQVEQARAERNEVQYQLDAAQQLVLFQVEEAYRNLIIARAALESRQEQLTLSREWRQTEAVNFDLDLGDTENLVDAVRTSLELEIGYYEAVRQYNVAVLRLLNATGILVDRVQTGMLVD
jgi:outer membrane protein